MNPQCQEVLDNMTRTRVENVDKDNKIEELERRLEVFEKKERVRKLKEARKQFIKKLETDLKTAGCNNVEDILNSIDFEEMQKKFLRI